LMRPNHGRGHGKRRRRSRHRCFVLRNDPGTCLRKSSISGEPAQSRL
jgi:hypothetical protein